MKPNFSLLLDVTYDPYVAKDLLTTFDIWICRYKLSEAVDAEDILSEARIRLSDKYMTGEYSVNCVKAWLRATGYNIIRERSRDRSKTDQMIMDLICLYYRHSSPVEALEERERRDLVASLTNELNSTEKNLIQLRYFYGFSWRQVAQELNITEQAARQQGSRVVRKLREQLVVKRISNE
jgi:RNA polymerase sigma factor (sigma-70 family)